MCHGHLQNYLSESKTVCQNVVKTKTLCQELHALLLFWDISNYAIFSLPNLLVIFCNWIFEASKYIEFLFSLYMLWEANHNYHVHDTEVFSPFSWSWLAKLQFCRLDLMTHPRLPHPFSPLSSLSSSSPPSSPGSSPTCWWTCPRFTRFSHSLFPPQSKCGPRPVCETAGTHWWRGPTGPAEKARLWQAARERKLPEPSRPHRATWTERGSYLPLPPLPPPPPEANLSDMKRAALVNSQKRQSPRSQLIPVVCPSEQL